MKYIKILSMSVILALGAGMVFAFISKTDRKAGNGFAVVELFTSEGCSSCPPAEELMVRLQSEYKDKDVYLLAYHVDYFDQLGWKDTFGSPAHTSRQTQYGSWLKKRQIYTPQAIVNGKYEFVGSDEGVMQNAIRSELAVQRTSSLLLSARMEKRKIVLDYQVDKSISATRLAIAIIQKTAKVNVKSGENGGKQLLHIQIVQQLTTQVISASGKGSTSITVPLGFDPKGWEVLGMVQNMTSGEILTATRAGLERN
ncbi:DUF1223 domain-containing protein [Pedobacter frigiditerrae]|uniref:DUF1223 domain-containing protein n=1 Tax=Pedobacter frigiditerrae TaxID=2530452 RepID=A0A4R0MWY4_9SPHI|nr:DUF1223 domain-containing protein [Pedobacter frigiditerrae]TCC91720.1 DUF1223 domain-containing protein [Pedobacter frigiditerrae]